VCGHTGPEYDVNAASTERCRRGQRRDDEDDQDGKQSPGQSSDISDGFASFDLGWVVGLGLGVGHGQFDLRYSGGLTDISDSPILRGAIPAADGTGVKFRNRGFVLMAAIRF
jgi:hypothetical protein